MNLVSSSLLDREGYSIISKNSKTTIFSNKEEILSFYLRNNLYTLITKVIDKAFITQKRKYSSSNTVLSNKRQRILNSKELLL